MSQFIRIRNDNDDDNDNNDGRELEVFRVRSATSAAADPTAVHTKWHQVWFVVQTVSSFLGVQDNFSSCRRVCHTWNSAIMCRWELTRVLEYMNRMRLQARQEAVVVSVGNVDSGTLAPDQLLLGHLLLGIVLATSNVASATLRFAVPSSTLPLFVPTILCDILVNPLLVFLSTYWMMRVWLPFRRMFELKGCAGVHVGNRLTRDVAQNLPLLWLIAIWACSFAFGMRLEKAIDAAALTLMNSTATTTMSSSVSQQDAARASIIDLVISASIALGVILIAYPVFMVCIRPCINRAALANGMDFVKRSQELNAEFRVWSDFAQQRIRENFAHLKAVRNHFVDTKVRAVAAVFRLNPSSWVVRIVSLETEWASKGFTSGKRITSAVPIHGSSSSSSSAADFRPHIVVYYGDLKTAEVIGPDCAKCADVVIPGGQQILGIAEWVGEHFVVITTDGSSNATASDATAPAAATAPRSFLAHFCNRSGESVAIVTLKGVVFSARSHARLEFGATGITTVLSDAVSCCSCSEEARMLPRLVLDDRRSGFTVIFELPSIHPVMLDERTLSPLTICHSNGFVALSRTSVSQLPVLCQRNSLVRCVQLCPTPTINSVNDYTPWRSARFHPRVTGASQCIDRKGGTTVQNLGLDMFVVVHDKFLAVFSENGPAPVRVEVVEAKLENQVLGVSRDCCGNIEQLKPIGYEMFDEDGSDCRHKTFRASWIMGSKRVKIDLSETAPELRLGGLHHSGSTQVVASFAFLK